MSSTARERLARQSGPAPTALRGEALFSGTSYPRKWEHYIGQDKAVRHIKIAAASAKARFARLDHVLIAAGGHGIGKSAIVRLIAQEMGAGLMEVQGALDEKTAIRLLRTMEDGDILFWDEFHQAVSKGAVKAEWLLSYLQDGVIISNGGAIKVPNVTIIAATTDVQKIQETIISRFPIRPGMDEYTIAQAMEIAAVTATGIFRNLNMPVPSHATYEKIAGMASNNPRAIGQVLRNLRDMALAQEITTPQDGNYEMQAVAELMDLTMDGLDDLAQRYLLVLGGGTFEGKPAGEKAIAAVLGEPTPPRHTEKLLLNKGYIQLTPQGRTLTTSGAMRYDELVLELQ